MTAHQFDDRVDGLTYCSRCGLWDGVANHPLYRCTPRRPHIVDGEFQSDKYPTTPRGKVPLSVEDPTAQDLLWQYAQRRRAVDAEFADDLEYALTRAGYQHPAPADPIDSAPDLKADPRAQDDANEKQQAELLYACVQGALKALQVSADTTKAKNYVAMGFTGLTLPFDRAEFCLIRPGGRTPTELVADLQAALALLRTGGAR